MTTLGTPHIPRKVSVRSGEFLFPATTSFGGQIHRMIFLILSRPTTVPVTRFQNTNPISEKFYQNYITPASLFQRQVLQSPHIRALSKVMPVPSQLGQRSSHADIGSNGADSYTRVHLNLAPQGQIKLSLTSHCRFELRHELAIHVILSAYCTSFSFSNSFLGLNTYSDGRFPSFLPG